MNQQPISTSPGSATPEFEPNIPARHRSGRHLAASSSRSRPIIGLVAADAPAVQRRSTAPSAMWHTSTSVDPASAGRWTAYAARRHGPQTSWRRSSARISQPAASDQAWNARRPFAERTRRVSCAPWCTERDRPARRSWKSGPYPTRCSTGLRSKPKRKAIDPDAELVFTSWLNPRIHPAARRTPIHSGRRCARHLRLAVDHPDHHPGRLPARRRRGHLPGGIRHATTGLNRIIQTNINNLAGVPSIIYGMLGLAIFVRALEPLTSGAIFGLADADHRQRAHHPLGRPDPGAADPAADHHQRPGGHPRRAAARCARPATAWARPSGRRSGTTCCPTPCPAS